MPVPVKSKMRMPPKVLHSIYGDRVQTLRQIILQLLGASLSNANCECGGLYGEHFKYCAKCDPPGYLLRDDDHAEYWKLLECSYGVVSNMAPPALSFTLENRWTQCQIIERAIELQFRQATKPLNVICYGYQQPQPNHAETTSTSAPYGLESTNSNSATMLLNSEAWVVLLSRVGDMFMLHFLLYTSIFYPLPNNSYLQIAGIPISSLVSSFQSHELMQIGLANCDATEICKTSDFQTESTWSHLRNRCQSEDLSLKPVQLPHEAKVPSIGPSKNCDEMDKTIPVTRCTGLSLNFHNSIRNGSSKNGNRKSCKGAHKIPFTSDHWTGGCKKKKANIDEIQFNPKKLFNSSIVHKSGESCKDGYSSKVAGPDFHHGLHMLTDMKTLYRWSKEHTERVSVEPPERFFCWSKKSPAHFLSSSKSDSAQHPFLHLKWSAETESGQRCSNFENISLIHNSSSCNIAKREGRLKKRSRLFSWQRRKIYKTQESSSSNESMEQNSRMKEGSREDYTKSQQLQALSENNDNTLEAINEMQTQPCQKNEQKFSLDKSHVPEKLYSQLIANPANPVAFKENAKQKHQCMFLSNARKFSCRCLCWLMLQTRHMDTANTFINRRSLFYNSKFSHHGGFPLNHILNVIKPRISDAKQLLAIIFGISVSCLHEQVTDRAGVSESSCQNWSLVSLLKILIRNARDCQYAKLLTRHCPVQFKQPRQASPMPSSKMIDSYSFMEDHETQDKETSSILHGITDRGNNPLAVHVVRSPQVVSRNHGQHGQYDCLIHCEHLNERGLFKDRGISGSQHATVGDCLDEEKHASGTFRKHSRMHRLSLKRKHGDHCNSGVNDYTNGWDSKHSNMLVDRSEEPSNGLQNELIKSHSSHKEVVSFIWAVCRRVIPEALLGSKHNWRALRSNIGKFVKLRRFEKFTLQQCLYKLKTSHFSWLNGATLTCKCCASLNGSNERCPIFLYDPLENNAQQTYHYSTDTNKGGTGSQNAFFQEKMLANWIFWIFSSMIVPLIQAHFYVTETQNGRKNVFYYRKTVWAKIMNGAIKNLTRRNYKRVSAASLASILQKRSLGFSHVRILPKENGVRPIANLGARSTTWLELHKDLGKTTKRRKTNRVANNLLLFDVNNSGKGWKQMGFIEKQMQFSVDNLLIKGNREGGREDKCESFACDQLISDKPKKEKLNLYGSDSKVKLAFRSVNSLLCDVHHCLKFEQENCPEALGCSVFDYNDIYVKLLPFVLGLKDYSMGLPKLYIAVCDVAQAFDTVDQDKLLDVIQNIVLKEEYFIQRYTKVSCTAKSVKVSYERGPVAEKGVSFVNYSTNHSSKHSQGILIDQAFFTNIKQDKLLGLIYEHVKRNILQIGPHFYIQKVGIPQGSVLSSLLCSFYYGDLDRNKIFPLLNHTQKKHTVVPFETAFEDCLVNRKLSSGKVCNEGSLVGEVNTTIFKEMDKISGITARQSRMMRIEGESLNAGLNACSSDILQCSSDIVNGHKTGNQESVLPKSILLRLIDDTLFISTSKKKAFCFIASMHRGFKDYNSHANKCKTSLNFKMELEGEKLCKNVYKCKDGSCFLRWSGLLINCNTLEIQADYTRYCASHIRSTITVWSQKNPGYHLLVKLCQFMRPKCHPIFYDSNMNSPTTVRLNAYQAFLLCAMKFHVYACSVPSVGAFSPRYAFQAIMKSMRYMYKLVKQRMHDIGVKTSTRPIFSLQQKEIEWLGLYAYRKALQRKQSRYKQLLSFLEAKLHSSKFQHLAELADLHFAVDDRHSSMFWQIKY